MACNINILSGKNHYSDIRELFLDKQDYDKLSPSKQAEVDRKALAEFTRIYNLPMPDKFEKDGTMRQDVFDEYYRNLKNNLASDKTQYRVSDSGKRRLLANLQNRVNTVQRELSKMLLEREALKKKGKYKEASNLNHFALQEKLERLTNITEGVKNQILKHEGENVGGLLVTSPERVMDLNNRIEGYFRRTLEEIAEGYNRSGVTNAELVDYIRTLRFIGGFNDFYEGKDSPTQMKQFSEEARRLEKLVLNRSKEQLLSRARKFPTFASMQKAAMDKLSADSVRKAWSLDLTRSKNEFVRWVGTFMQDQKRNMEVFIREKAETLGKVLEKIPVEDRDKFYAVAADGTILRNRFRDYVNQEYYDELSRFTKDARDAANPGPIHDNRRKFFSQHTLHIDPEYFDQKLSQTDRNKIMANFLNEVAKKGITDQNYIQSALARMEDGYKSYESEYIEYEKSLGSDPDKQKKLDDFRLQYHPKAYYDSRNGKKKPPFPRSKYYRPMVVSEKYLDKEFFSMMENPDYKEAFDTITSMNNEMLNFLPEELKEEVGANFLFRAKADLAETLRRGGVNAMMLFMKEDFVDKLHSYLDSPYIEIDESTGKELKRVNVQKIENVDKMIFTLNKKIERAMVDLANHKAGTTQLTDLQVEQLKKDIEEHRKRITQLEAMYSTDLFQNIITLVNVASAYKFMSDIQSEVNMAEHIITGASSYEASENLQPLREAFDFAVDSLMYGRHKAREARLGRNRDGQQIQDKLIAGFSELIDFNIVTPTQWRSMFEVFGIKGITDEELKKNFPPKTPSLGEKNLQIAAELSLRMMGGIVNSREAVLKATLDLYRTMYNTGASTTFTDEDQFRTFIMDPEGMKNLEGVPLYEVDGLDLDELKELKDVILKAFELLNDRFDLNNNNKVMSVAQILDQAMKFQQLKSLGLNPLNGFGEMSFGAIANIIHASGGRDFEMGHLMSAFKTMLSATKKMMTFGKVEDPNAKKILAMMYKFGMTGELMDIANDKTIGTSNWVKTMSDAPYLFLKKADYFNKGVTTVALLMGKRVTVDGKEMSLWEAFDEEGNFIGTNSKADWEGDPLDPDSMPKLRAERSRIVNINKRVHGNFDSNSPVLLKKHVFGRLVSQFRLSWLAEGLENRFANKYYDESLEREVEGRYRTLWRVAAQDIEAGGVKKFLDTLKKAMLTADKATLTEDDLLVRENLRKTIVEMGFTASIFLMITMLKRLAEDDDDDNTALKIAANLLYRTQQDLTFYMNPMTIEQIINRPVPVIAVATDFSSAIGGVYKYVVDEDYEGEKAFLRITKSFPLISNINRINFVSTEDAGKR